MSKQFGLILPESRKKQRTQPKPDFTKPSIFGSDSDSDGTTPAAPVRKTALTIGPGVNEKRQARKIQEKALQEDPTIFQYDELYDEIENKRDQQKKEKSQEVKTPKYIARLLESAERRKIENERRLERMIQKERELEGEEFKDKESFVTSAYRKKLEELRKAEEREKREEYLEAIGDVTKQRNLDGFYRHLYEQKLGHKDEIKDVHNNDADKSTVEKEPSSQSNFEENQSTSAASKFKPTKSRMYRKRKSSDDDEARKSPEKEVSTKKAHLQSNLDADSDFSIDSSTSEDENEAKFKAPLPPGKPGEKVVIKKEPEDENKIQSDITEKTSNPLDNKENGQKLENVKEEPSDDSKDDKKLTEVKSEKEKPKIIKKDIWKKRTVGEVFDAALQRYYERKAARNG